MKAASWVVFTVDTATVMFYAALIVIAIYLLYRLYKLAMSLGLGLFSGVKAVVTGTYELLTEPGVTVDEMFTPRNADGSVAPNDIVPKGTDPIDWIFMDHSLSEPI